MSDPFVAEIRIFGFNFAPRGWAFCNGQILPISQNTALFSLLGTQYGGNGQSTFALPDMQAAAAIHQGQGPGLSQYFIGQQSGSQAVTLLVSEMPSHNHSFSATNVPGAAGLPTNTATNNQLRKTASGNPVSGLTQGKIYSAANPLTQMNPQGMAIAGSSFPHNNMMPFLTLNYCIALQGIFPPRS
jgi:microcystin-dependent protein